MLKIGDICVGHYCYSMEIYNFYMVTKITEKSVTFEKLEKDYIEGGFQPLVTPKVKYSILGDRLYTPTGCKFTRRLKGNSSIKDETGYGYIKPEGASEEALLKGYREDHLD